MSDASDMLREFGDAVDAGRTSKIKESEPSHWAALDDAPTGPLTPGQVKCVSCQENERSRAASSPVDGLCTFCRDSGDVRLGHQFHFQAMIQGAHRGADGLYHDEEAPVEYEPFTITVRAWSLAAACAKLARLPLSAWKHAGEESV